MSSCSIYTTFEQFNYGEKKLDPHSAGIYFQFLSFKTWRNLCLGRFFSRKNTAVPNHYRTLAGWGSTLTVAYWRRGAAYEKTHREEIYLSLVRGRGEAFKLERAQVSLVYRLFVS